MRTVSVALVVACQAALLLTVYGAFQCPGNGNYAYPNNCSLYYACNGGVATVMTCPAGLYFDPSGGYCNWPQLVYCPLRDGTTPPPPPSNVTQTTANYTMTTWPSGGNNGSSIPTPPYVCPVTPINYYGMYPDPQDCHYFIQCNGNRVPYRKICSGGLYFNPILQLCDYSCQVYKAAFLANRLTSTSAAQSVVPFDSVPVNDMSVFKQASSTFTAPDDGFYYFSMTAGVASSQATTYTAVGNNGSNIALSVTRSQVLSGANVKALEQVSRDDLLWLRKNQTIRMSSTSALYSDSMAQTNWLGFRVDYLNSPFVGFNVVGTGVTTSTTMTKITSYVVNNDVVGSWNANQSSYAVPFSGLYQIAYSATCSFTSPAPVITLYVNGVAINANYPSLYFGVATTVATETLSASALVSLQQNDTLSVYQSGAATCKVSVSSFMYSEINGYNNTAWYATTNAAYTGLVDPLPLNTVLVNQGAAWRSTSNSVVAQVGGLYYVAVSSRMSASFQVRLLYNGNAVSSLQSEFGQNGPTHSRATLIRLNVNDTLRLQLPKNYTLTTSNKVAFTGIRLYP